jgi:hypothetical protein
MFLASLFALFVVVVIHHRKTPPKLFIKPVIPARSKIMFNVDSAIAEIHKIVPKIIISRDLDQYTVELHKKIKNEILHAEFHGHDLLKVLEEAIVYLLSNIDKWIEHGVYCLGKI